MDQPACIRSSLANDLPASFLPEEGDLSIFKRVVLDTVISDVAQLIKRSLITAGFARVQVSKIIHHSVYEISMRRGNAMLEDTEVQIRGRIRRALKTERLYRNSKTNLLVVDVQRQRIVCGFHTGEQGSPEPLAAEDL